MNEFQGPDEILGFGTGKQCCIPENVMAMPADGFPFRQAGGAG
jgi:hypothetical protein